MLDSRCGNPVYFDNFEVATYRGLKQWMNNGIITMEARTDSGIRGPDWVRGYVAAWDNWSIPSSLLVPGNSNTG